VPNPAYDQAEALYRRAVAANPSLALARAGLAGLLYAVRGDHVAAKVRYT
jgi:Tfp pilus assembly protein PilF